MRVSLIALCLLGAAAAPLTAQGMPGAADVSRVQAGIYTVDPNHTQVVWKVNHLGISPLYGAFGAPTGTLTLDPRAPGAAKLDLTFPMSGLTVTSPAFAKHLATPDFFDVATFPDARFVSTRVVASGTSAKITGNLTLHGVTKPVVLDARFYGAGTNSMSKKLNIGFQATGTLKRSDFGLGGAVPMVSDAVELQIAAAFEKQ